MNKGFTLAEILVVLAVLVIVGMMLTEVFFKSLRGGNKAELISTIKQNGQSVLETIDKNIRGSDNVVCPRIVSPSTRAESDVIAIVKDGTYTRYRLVNSQLVEDKPVLQAGVSQEQFLLDICTNVGYPQAVSSIITDVDKMTVLPPSGGNVFTRFIAPGFKDAVTINFLLGPSANVPKAVADSVDPVSFITTIQLR